MDATQTQIHLSSYAAALLRQDGTGHRGRLNRRIRRACRAGAIDGARLEWLLDDHDGRKARLHEERLAAFARLDRELDEAYGHDRADFGHDGGPEWYEPVLEDCYRFQD